MWSPDYYVNMLYDKAIRNHPKDYDKRWQKYLKEQLQSSIGEFSFPKTEIHTHLLEEQKFDDFVRIRVEVTVTDSIKVPVYILIPNGNPHLQKPAVLALHGHGYGSKEIVGLSPKGEENREDPGIHNNFAIKLVRNGMVVVAPEIVGFGDRKLSTHPQSEESPNENSCFIIGSQLLLLGKTLAGLRVFECFRIIDYMMSLEEIDNRRIGCMGFSGGGLIASYTSALDERIKAAVICGFPNTFKGSIMARKHCLDNYIPGILEHSELPELIGLIAPRPLFVESGTMDHLFPIEKTQRAVDRLREIYCQFDAGSMLSYDFFKGGHEVSGRNSVDWLYNHLSS